VLKREERKAEKEEGFYQSVSLVEIVAPVRADGLLAADVPHVQLEVVLLQRFDVEALRRRNVLDVLQKRKTRKGKVGG